MKSKRVFYRTVFTVEVLSEEPLDCPSLDELHYLITDGPASGDTVQESSEKVCAKEMARLLLKQGSDPSFFQLSEEGEDLDLDDEERR